MKPVQKQQTPKPIPKRTEPRPAGARSAAVRPNLDLPDINKWGIVIGLVVFVFVLYGNTIMHDYALDDDIITRRNDFVQQGIPGIGHIFSKGFLYGFNRRNDQSYRPVTLTSIAIEKQIWGNNPHVHHFFNVFWYAVTAVFLFLTLIKFFRKYNYVVPLFITLLFIAHPVHTEVVANIKSRDEILSFMFCIMALYCSFRYYCYAQPKYYKYLSWLFFFIAILSKETVLMFAVIIPMTFYFFTDFPVKKIAILALPYAALVVLYMFMRGHILDSITFDEQMVVINNTLMAAKTNADRFATTVYILAKYVWLLFVPVTLSWDYSYNQIPIVSLSSPQALLSLALYAGLIVYALLRLKRKDPVSYGILYYIITMTLVSNLFVKIGSSMGERFLYTSSLGFCIAVSFIIFRLLKVKIDAFKPKLTLIYPVAAVILLAFSVKTVARNADWKNNFTLFESGVVTSPNSARAQQSMAITYTDTANTTPDPIAKNSFYTKAIKGYYAALQILPNYSEAWYNLGWNFFSMGNYDSAAAAYRKCIQADPQYAAAYQNLGVIYFNEKKYTVAIPVFEAGASESPNDANLYGNLGAAFYNIGRYDSCIYYSQKALNIDPGLNSARQNLARAEDAIKHSNVN